MELTKEKLDMLEELGSYFFSISEAAIVLVVDEHELKELMSDKTSEAYKRYYKGFLMSTRDLREGILKMAKRGSNPAQKMLLDILQDARAANL